MKRHLNLAEAERASLMPAWRARFLLDMMLSVQQEGMSADLASHYKTSLTAHNGRLAVAEGPPRRNNNHFANGKLKLLEASYMHSVDKRPVMKPCSATKLAGIPAEPRTQEVLLGDHYLAPEKSADGCGGWESFAGLVVIEMLLSRNGRTRLSVQ